MSISVQSPIADEGMVELPDEVMADVDFEVAKHDATAWKRLRCRHDFVYWARECCVIKHKLSGREVPFELNAPQMKLLKVFETERLAGRPIRVILLKSRQWGGSTLVQFYMAWLQSCHCRNWNSIIVSQVKDTSKTIRGMYSRMLKNYPVELWEGDEKPRLKVFEGSQNVREIAGRGCRVTVASIENQDAMRGSDFAMAHLTEVAFWKSTPRHSPDDLIRAVCASIASVANSLVVIESTANGVGNYFHTEWQRAVNGESDKIPVFVGWHEIEYNRIAGDDDQNLMSSLSPYEQMLRDRYGCGPEQIRWYGRRMKEYRSHQLLMAEYPTCALEAFINSGTGLFSVENVERLRVGCREPLAVGEIVRCETRSQSENERMAQTSITQKLRNMASGVGMGRYEFYADSVGRLMVWEHPVEGGEYVAAVDIGGRTDGADWSVVAVFRTDCEKPCVVAQWRGHIDHDILADTASAIGAYYNEALLVVESNSLEHSGVGQFVLEGLRRAYNNLYYRSTGNVGFHTNRSTKEKIITGLMAAVREGSYEERCHVACNEMMTYEQKQNGGYGAKDGCHDDVLMTRAIALDVIFRG